MQKIDRNALVQAQISGGCAKNRAQANSTSTVIIYVNK
jgi:hypothetical protein